ncbi:MAG TPA: ComEC/Rec2 family competence protein, partial [Candidatus Dormibacteraeota bacterium]|nr:ComEC/Rec2 family competence protein [Candidatus Dormibacteraeota bacterium]
MLRLNLLGIAAAFAFGVALCEAIPNDARATLLVLAAIASFAIWRRGARLRFFLTLAGIALVGASDARLHALFTHPLAAARTARYAAVTQSAVPLPAGGCRVTLALHDGPRVEAVIRRCLPAGSSVLMRGRLQPFDGPRNRGDPDLRAIEAERGLAGELAHAEVLAIRRTPERLGTVVVLHAWASAQFRKRFTALDGALLSGELWGARDALPPAIRSEFTSTGTVHVLVTAGLHLGVVLALVLALLRALHAPRIVVASVGIAALWSFALFAGAHLPTLRAATMASFALFAYACGRSAFSLDAYAAALLLVLALNPESFAGASFALSFSCVGAILLCMPTLEPLFERMPLPRIAREALLLTLATQLGTWPVSAAIFLQFATYALPANLAIVPSVGATMLLGALTLLATPLPALAQLCANLTAWALAWQLGAVHFFASLPMASIAMTPAPFACIAAYDAALVLAMWALRRGFMRAAIATLAAASWLVLAPPHAIDPRLHLWAIDVGQGEALLVRTPGGHAFVVDAGGKMERGNAPDALAAAERIGQRTVVPFLLRRDIHALDFAMLSHAHGDHAGGIAPLLRHLHVARVADPGERYNGAAYLDALRTAHARGIPVLQPKAGARWAFDDGVTLTFIGPPIPHLDDGANRVNDNSLAFVLR